MSNIQPPVSDSEVSGHAADSWEPPKPMKVTDESITAGMILRRTKLLEEFSDVHISETVSALPTKGSTFLLKFLFTAVLEDVITQLWILVESHKDKLISCESSTENKILFKNVESPVLERCSTELALIKTLSDMDYLKALKFGVYEANEVKDELDGIDVKNLGCTIYKIKKLDADRKYVNKVMVATYLGLAQSFSFEPLVSYTTAIEELDRYRLNLAEEENKNKMLRKELSRQVRQQRNHIKTVLYDTDAIVEKLKNRVEDSVLYAELSCRYIQNWQEARSEQHTQTIFDIENKPTTEIEYFKERTEHELRVHTEVETLVAISITETLDKIENWMEKFENDMERIDLKIQIKKNEYQDKCEANKRNEEMLARHDVKMKEWIHFKAEREEARRYHEKMLNSAIIVQAWWRGLLVRLCLGPYRVKKSKKDKNKKKP